jgi:hypothetical protein
MLTLHFYTRPGCTLCDSALAVVKRVQQRVPFQLQIQNIDENPELKARYDTVIPVVTCENTELARSFIDEKTLLSDVKKWASQPPKKLFSRSLDNNNA